MKSKKLLPWLVLIVIVVLAAGIWADYFLSKKSPAWLLTKKPAYVAVYLQTGDIYYGRISWWPHPYLEDVWYLQPHDESGQPQLAPFKDIFWGPGEKLYLNPRQIVWWNYIRSDSDLIAAFEKAALQTSTNP